MKLTFKRFSSSISLTQLTWLLVVICLPAFFIHLAEVPFIGDEAIRTLVSFEMKMSGDYIVPTLSGEEYFNKPPLFNWFIILFSQIFGGFGEWSSRFTTLFFLGLFGLTVYYFVRRQTDRLTALTMALLLVTSGRILFWDSMLALIDICFSWIVYMNFMILYTLGKARRWRLMFLLSYFLFSIAFLLKGFPALVFQGISVIVALQMHRSLKTKLLSLDHWMGIFVGIVPVMAYYILYANQVSMEEVIKILFEQSVQRTPVRHGLWETVIHFFRFPIEQLYHFFPWSLLLCVFFHPKVRMLISENEFVRFNFWMLVANLPVYWLSAGVFPRYLLMFIPLFNLIGYVGLLQINLLNGKWWKVARIIFIILTVLGLVGIIGMPVVPMVRELSFIWEAWIVSGLLMALGLLGLLYDVKRIFIWFAFVLLVSRSVFNVVVLPIRAAEHEMTLCKMDCHRIGLQYGSEAMYIYRHSYLNDITKVYTSIYANQIIYHVDEVVDSSAIYLVQKEMNLDIQGYQIDSLTGVGGRLFALMRFEEK